MKQKIIETNGNVSEGVETLINNIEQEHGSKIFTLRVGEGRDGANEARTPLLIIFEDKAILEGEIIVSNQDGRPSINIKGNYI